MNLIGEYIGRSIGHLGYRLGMGIARCFNKSMRPDPDIYSMERCPKYCTCSTYCVWEWER